MLAARRGIGGEVDIGRRRQPTQVAVDELRFLQQLRPQPQALVERFHAQLRVHGEGAEAAAVGRGEVAHDHCWQLR